MSEFNGRKFYGFSLHNDPALATSTRNFEFRYACPESIERAIKKVQLSNETTTDTQKKSALLNKYCKPKGLRRTDDNPVKSRDLDVETQLSLKEDAPLPSVSLSEYTSGMRPSIRKLSESEIENLIGRAKTTMEMVGDQRRGILKQMHSTTTETQAEADDDELPVPMSEQTTQTLENAMFEIFCHPQPQWVEIEENSGTSKMLVSEIKQLLCSVDEKCDDTKAGKLPNLYQHLSQMQQQQEQFIKFSQSQPAADKRCSGHNPNAYYVEDSDYEYEMMGRAAYTKFCGPRPREDDTTNVSNEDGGIAQFVEIEPRIPCMNLSFLKNTAPIRYTEYTDETQEDDTHIEASQMKVFIKNLKSPNPIEAVNVTKPAEKKVTEKNPLPRESTTIPTSQQTVKTTTKPSKKQNKKSSALSQIDMPPMRGVSPRKYLDSSLFKKHISPNGSPKTTPRKIGTTFSPRENMLVNPNRVKIKKMHLTKSIEELKVEKIGIFAKMTGTQESIIELLDKLRLNLLEIYVPESTYDKSKRQKNAFEFSVRFSRNFLYPLKGMIDDLRNTPSEHFHSTASNEACSRVGSIYMLIQQSLVTYQKQLRYFLLDQVPQKLSALIDMIQILTQSCLEKSIFDRQDGVVECLLDRCGKFTVFLEDMHEERFLTARENYCKTNLGKKPIPSVHTKYDLKMFMNDLNMYEPKLVPKHSRQKAYQKQKQAEAGPSEGSTSKKQRRASKPKKVVAERSQSENSSSYDIKAEECSVPTQVQIADQSSELLSSVQNLLSSSSDKLNDKDKTEEVTKVLNKAVIEALQLVTKEQVRKVLEPIIQTLGTALDKKNNSETIEAILKALNKKSFATKQNENIKRHDTEKISSGSKVTTKKVKTTNSTSSIKKPTNASKSSQQTKNLSLSTKRESTKAAISATASAAGTSTDGGGGGGGVAAAGACSGVEANSATATETESELENGAVPEEKAESQNKFHVQISKKKRIEELQQQEQRLIRRREQLMRQEQFHKHLHYQQKHLEQQLQFLEQKTPLQEESKQLQRSHHVNNQATTDQKGGGKKAKKLNTNDQQENEPQTPIPTTTTGGAGTTNRDAAKVFATASSNRSKPSLYKKKRNVLRPPPPAPAATPQSARTPRSAHFSYIATNSGGEAEETHRTAATTQRTDNNGEENNNSIHNKKSSVKPKSRGKKNDYANNSKMTSHRDSCEALKALTAAIANQPTSDTETVAVAAAIAAALGPNNFNDNEEALNLFQSSDIFDVLTKCIANAKLNVPNEDDDEDADDDKDYDEDLPIDNAGNQADANKGGGEAYKYHGAGGDNHDDMYSKNPTLSNQQKIHMEQLQKQQLQVQRNQLLQQLQKNQQQKETNLQQYRVEFGRTANTLQKSPEQPISGISQKSPRRPLNEINQQNYGNFSIHIGNKENTSNSNTRHKSRPAKLDLKLDRLLHERDSFLGLCSQNRFYANPNYSEPWKVFSRISEKLATEIVNSVEEDFSFGVSKFVHDFLQLETQT